MEEMTKMAATMNPNLLPKGMPKVSPSQFKEAQEKMKTMSPEELKDTFAQSKAHMDATKRVAVPGKALTLKEKGTNSFKAAKYPEAIVSYTEALNAVASIETSAITQDFKVSVLANIAFCHMKLSQWSECINFSSQVLSLDPSNVKALFRRGVAYRHTNRVSLALRDLREAARIAPSDKPVIAELLEVEAMDPGVDEDLPESLDPPMVEEVFTKPSVPSKPSVSSSTSDMFRNNPQMFDGVTEMMAGMPEDQLEAMMASTGMNMKGDDLKAMKEMMKNKDMMKTMADMMKNVDPSELQAMAEGMRGASSSSGATGAPPSMPDASALLSDPKVVKQMETMLEAMPDSTFDEMIKQATGSEAPSMVTPSRMRTFAKIMMKLVRFWLLLKVAMAWMMTKQGAFIIAIVILLISVLAQFVL